MTSALSGSASSSLHPLDRLDPLAKGGEAVKAGPVGLGVILLLCIACYFLFKSMSKHLRNVRENFPVDEPPPAVPPAASAPPAVQPTAAPMQPEPHDQAEDPPTTA